jgi:uncharacterized protein YutE (UPF0331/DUF86 family)
MSLNPDLIWARCAEIDSSLARLEAFRSLSREQYLSNQDTLDVACYRLLIAIESALALCFHVSAKRLHQVPEEYDPCGSLRPLATDGAIQKSARACVLED